MCVFILSSGATELPYIEITLFLWINWLMEAIATKLKTLSHTHIDPRDIQDNTIKMPSI